MADDQENSVGSADASKMMEREERLKQARKKQKEDQDKKLLEIKEAERKAEEFRKKQEDDRRMKMLELRKKDEDHRASVERRRRQLEDEENVKRKAAMKKSSERDGKLHSTSNRNKSGAIGFGSSTARLVGGDVPRRSASQADLKTPHMPSSHNASLENRLRFSSACTNDKAYATLPRSKSTNVITGSASPGSLGRSKSADIGPRRSRADQQKSIERLATPRNPTAVPTTSPLSSNSISPTPSPQYSSTPKKPTSKVSNFPNKSASPSPKPLTPTPKAAMPKATPPRPMVPKTLPTTVKVNKQSPRGGVTPTKGPVKAVHIQPASEMGKKAKSPIDDKTPPSTPTKPPERVTSPTNETPARKPSRDMTTPVKKPDSGARKSETTTPRKQDTTAAKKPEKDTTTPRKAESAAKKPEKDATVSKKTEKDTHTAKKPDKDATAKKPEKELTTKKPEKEVVHAKKTEKETTATPKKGEKVLTEAEVEYKAKLAEKRRLAREKAERENEEERLRKEKLRLEEEERLAREAEEERQRMEEEMRQAEQARQAEELRLKMAIEAEERRKQEEAERLEAERKAKEEAEEKAKKEAEKREQERVEQQRKDEEERLQRKKKLEMIMKRVKKDDSPKEENGGSAPSSKPSSPPLIASPDDDMARSLTDSSNKPPSPPVEENIVPEEPKTELRSEPSVVTELKSAAPESSDAPKFKSPLLQQMMKNKAKLKSDETAKSLTSSEEMLAEKSEESTGVAEDNKTESGSLQDAPEESTIDTVVEPTDTSEKSSQLNAVDSDIVDDDGVSARSHVTEAPAGDSSHEPDTAVESCGVVNNIGSGDSDLVSLSDIDVEQLSNGTPDKTTSSLLNTHISSPENDGGAEEKCIPRVNGDVVPHNGLYDQSTLEGKSALTSTTQSADFLNSNSDLTDSLITYDDTTHKPDTVTELAT